MPDEFFCVLCRKPILANKKFSALYCGQDCKNEALNARRREETLKRRLEKDHIVSVHADWIRKFRHELLKRATPEAGGYQAGLWTGQMVYWFPNIPERSKYRYTLNRTRSRHSFFLLEPFEPPSVPLVGEYQIRFTANISPYPDLEIGGEIWSIKIPFAVKIRSLPFKLAAVPRTLR